MRTKLDHASLTSKDIDRSPLLFQNLLGFDKLWQVGPLSGKAMASFFGLDEIEAELIMLRSKGGLALELVHVLKPSLENATPTGEMIKMFFIKTEENVLWEFVERLSP
ncbi:hypothetical protein AAU61_09445 [Desulfocarbo indianensis]|nr:hypothetical protein AAU61_09445 [Desulfocarbo indianensis]